MRDTRLTDYARSMRREMTEPEKRLWLQLRAERFESVKFRRQKVIGRYIADFAANAPKLVIEVDGGTHDDDDAARTHYLERQGYYVLRFTNLEVMSNLAGVLLQLAKVIALLKGSGLSAPLPTLSPKGERA